jgi:hypothetical protein
MRLYTPVRALPLAVLVCLVAGGCGFRVPLPPVELTVGPTARVDFGPGPGTPGGAPLNNAELPLPAICLLPSEADLDALVREAVGDFLADLVRVERVGIARLSATADAGSFDSLTRVAVRLRVDGPGGGRIPVGEVRDLEGLGQAFTIVPEAPVDLLPLLQATAPGCVIPELALDGRVPRQPTSFRSTIQIVVESSAGF